MPEITGVRFLLAVANLKRPTDHYTSVLGFGVDFGAPGWSFLSRGSFQIMLGECTDAVPPGEPGDHPFYGYITVADVDALYAEYQKSGAQFMQSLGCKNCGGREFGIRTLDCRRLMFLFALMSTGTENGEGSARGRDLQTRRAAVPLHSQHRIH
jgi:hypothetical protein